MSASALSSWPKNRRFSRCPPSLPRPPPIRRRRRGNGRAVLFRRDLGSRGVKGWRVSSWTALAVARARRAERIEGRVAGWTTCEEGEGLVLFLTNSNDADTD
ncbi:hypothetical protein ZWY2020_052109 [Hordeum vulgare]|nr:hypothetical protein ZWY2020_052109 [Hordeum vulgare]